MKHPKYPDGRRCPSCDTYFPESEYGFNPKRWAPYITCKRCRQYSRNYFQARKLARKNTPPVAATPLDRWLRMPLT